MGGDVAFPLMKVQIRIWSQVGRGEELIFSEMQSFFLGIRSVTSKVNR